MKALPGLLALVALISSAAPARAWDSGTHRMIARLAVDALPESALKSALRANERALQRDAVAPDTTLRERYGHAEAIRHYIDLERYGANPIAALSPDLRTMLARYGRYQVDRTGTLPWTIESEANLVRIDWQRDDCFEMIEHSGYLAHYVGDASQPLHTTIWHDCTEAQRGCHQRIEAAADHRTRELESAAAPEVRVNPITDVWAAEIAEISRSHAMVSRMIADDRAAHSVAYAGPAYTQALFAHDSALFTNQIADGVSTLASIWLFEWKQAGSPDRCTAAQ